MASIAVLEFERPIVQLEDRIAELRSLSKGGKVDVSAEVVKLEKKAKKLRTQVFTGLSRWQIVQLSRHPSRPYFLDYVGALFTDYCELSGDRAYGEDASILGGFARFHGQPVMIIGHQKGRTTKENMKRNFGMPRPEGYRKSKRLFELAERFNRPVLSFIDTPGAYPGIGAEERGQAEAIAVSLEVMASLTVPVISTVIGEGGSGGALAIGVANRVMMLEYSVYSVISPEGCASILFRDASHADKAAEALKPTASDLFRLGIVDQVLPEPEGGAHRLPSAMFETVGEALKTNLSSLQKLSRQQLVDDRYARFRARGAFGQDGL